MQTAAFAISQGIAFSVYGESLIIMVQNFVIIVLIWQYNKDIAIFEKIGVALVFGLYCFVLFQKGLLSDSHWQLISSSSTVLSKLKFTFLIIIF
jgi:hypothetical protein